MTVGVLLISHNEIGQSLLDNALDMFERRPLPCEHLPVYQDDDPVQSLQRARKLKHQLNQGDGVLILTDLYGSTPSNIAQRLLDEGDTRVVSGMNLPMLVRIFNYPQLPLGELAERALDGAREGIVLSGESSS